ncbi:MAG: protoporphyrinogen oxidase [Myxococcota bacterium]
MTRVAVVGGGVSGLAVAEACRFKNPGIETLVFEAEAQLGGKIGTSLESGFVVEHGPHGFLGREPKVFDVIDRLDLTPELIRADEASARRFLVRGGRLVEVPTGPQAFLQSPILPWSAKLRLLAEPLIPPDAPEEESVRAFAVRRLGAEAADGMVDAIVTGIFGGDPEQLSLPAAFPRMRELEHRYGSLIRAQLALATQKTPQDAEEKARRTSLHSFRSGLGELIGGLARSAGSLRVRAPVHRILRSRPGWTLLGDFESVDVDAVVLTVPADMAAQLVGPHSEACAAEMATVPYAPITVVSQAFRAEDIRRRPNGFGFVAPDREERPVLGSIWASSVFPEHAPNGTVLFRSLVGGVRRGERAHWDDETLFTAAKQELVFLAGLMPDAEPIHQRTIRWPRGIPQYVIGHRRRLEAADALEQRFEGLFIGGNGFRGVGVLDCIVAADAIAERVVAFSQRAS